MLEHLKNGCQDNSSWYSFNSVSSTVLLVGSFSSVIGTVLIVVGTVLKVVGKVLIVVGTL